MRPAFGLTLFVGMLIAIGESHSSLAQTRSTPLSAAVSMEQIELQSGYYASLLACEPLVVDPVDVAFDNAGRMWVIEMRDYPFRVAPEPQGRIRILTDRDGDGRYDHAHLFADQLEMPTGLSIWKDGAVVTLAGQLVYMRDTDGDLTADVKQVWLTGFAEENEQLRANHPRLSLDGKWTIATGLRGGSIQVGGDFPSTSSIAQPVVIGSRDVRFDPTTAEIELITGPAQFGLCFDPLGNRYFCSNRNPAVKVIFEQEDLLGNPLAGLQASVLDVLPAGEASQVFPLVESWTTSNLHAGQFTAACGVFVRLAHPDARLSGDGCSTEIFTCEPTGSLVKRSVVQHVTKYEFALTDDTASERREWLASRDAWFRPVNIAHTPDGGLAIVDMHRAVIEHPDWVPDELKKRPDERWGDDCGRIYSIHQGERKQRPDADDEYQALKQQPLNERTDEQLAQHVALGNAWFQENSARLLIERQATNVSSELLRYARDASVPIAGRVVAVKLAGGLGGIQSHELTSFLDAGTAVELQTAALQVIRETPSLHVFYVDAIRHRLAELDYRDANSAAISFEAWLTLAAVVSSMPDSLESSLRTSQPLLDQAALFGTRDAYQLVAVASALRSQPGRLLTRWIERLAENETLHAETLHAETLHAGAAFPESQLIPLAQALAIAELKRGDRDAKLFEEIVAVLATSAPRSQIAAMAALEQLVTRDPDLSQRIIDDVAWDTIQTLVRGGTDSLALQQVAIDLLSHSPRPGDSAFLADLAKVTVDPQSKTLYLTAWAARESEECDRLLLDLLMTGSPALQATSLKLIGERPSRVQLLVDKLHSGQLSAQQLGALELKNLISRTSGELQASLQQAYDSLVNSDRHQVVERYRTCLELTGDPRRGQQVFRTQCATCHQVSGIGVQVGPDISDSRTQQPLQLLTSILNPNLAIDNNYFRYVILTVDDQIVEGMVAEETADAIVIRGPENRRTVVARQEVAEMKATGVSMMPDGLEAQIDPQAMADLIAFIKNWRYLEGAIPGK